MDNSALEKLRCISAGGADEPFLLPIKMLQLGLYEKYQQISVILITGFGTIYNDHNIFLFPVTPIKSS